MDPDATKEREKSIDISMTEAAFMHLSSDVSLSVSSNNRALMLSDLNPDLKSSRSNVSLTQTHTSQPVVVDS